MMPKPLIKEMTLADYGRVLQLPPQFVRFAVRAGARTPEALFSLCESFPTIAGINTANVSNRIAESFGNRLPNLLGSTASDDVQRTRVAFGASAPIGADWQLGDELPVDDEGSNFADGTADVVQPENLTPAILHDPPCDEWIARDQGVRGTCVAFATAALREFLLCRMTGNMPRLSEQFLYWGIKTQSSDATPNNEGTYVENSFEILHKLGVCEDAQCRYNATQSLADVAHGSPPLGPPSGGAISSALAYRVNPSSHGYAYNTQDRSKPIFGLLENGPVAITVPVFSDPLSDGTNWTTRVAQTTGQILNPPDGSVVKYGHAVCLVGFVEDSAEPLGGHFIFRNSWGSRFGSLAGSPGHFGPRAGYGYLSVSYVDRFLWEYGQL